MTPLRPLPALLMFLIACSSSPGDPDAPDGDQAVAEFARAVETAVRAWDVDAWTSLVAEDVVMMAPNGRIVEGRDAFRALWERTFEGQTGSNPLQLTLRETRIEGDIAVVRAEYGPEGAAPVGHYVWLLERGEDGQWLKSWWIFTRNTDPSG